MKNIGSVNESLLTVKSTSLISDVDPLLGLSLQSISKESDLSVATRPHEVVRLCPPSTGSFCAYLALTFSTLLSSQASGAHRTRTFIPAWGNSAYFRRISPRSQTPTSSLPHSRPSHPDSGELSRAHPNPVVSSASGFLRVGRPRSADLQCPAPR